MDLTSGLVPKLFPRSDFSQICSPLLSSRRLFYQSANLGRESVYKRGSWSLWEERVLLTSCPSGVTGVGSVLAPVTVCGNVLWSPALRQDPDFLLFSLTRTPCPPH